MKIRFILLAILAFVLISVNSYAQLDEHKPGIYALVEGEYLPLPYSYSGGSGFSAGSGGVGVGIQKYNYPGATSGVNACDTFILVIDPEKKTGVVTPKKFDCFHKLLTPEDMLVLPLVSNLKKDRREYNPGTTVGVNLGGGATMSMNIKNEERSGYEWEQITDNSFKIKVSGLVPGEYGIVFRIAKLSTTYTYSSLFGFTIPEPAQEEKPSTEPQQ